MMQGIKKKNKNLARRCDQCWIHKTIRETRAQASDYFGRNDDRMLHLKLCKNVSILEPTDTAKALKQACEIFQRKMIFSLHSSVFVFIHSPQNLECFKENINPLKEPVQTKDLLNLYYENQPFMLCSEVTNQIHVIRKSHSTEKFFSIVGKEIKEKLQTDSYRVVYHEDLDFDLRTETQTINKVRKDLKSVYNKCHGNLKTLPSTQKQAHDYKYRRRCKKVLPSRRQIKSTLQVLQYSPVLQDSLVLQDIPVLQDSPVVQDIPALRDPPVLQDSPVLHEIRFCYPLSGMFHSKPLIPLEEVSFPTQVSEQTETGRDEVVFSSGRSIDAYHVKQSQSPYQLRHTAQFSEDHLTDLTPCTHVEPRGHNSRPPIPPRYPLYKEYYQRKQSFTNWVKRYPDPATLCDAGFFFTSNLLIIIWKQ